MMRIIYLTTCALLLIAPLSLVQAKQWCGITPLRSTRGDVEKLVGRPSKPNTSLYETDKELVHIIYATVPCEEGVAGAWNVPPDTVIRIEVTPKKTLYVKDFNIDESKYKKVEQPHISGAITYVNEEEGVLIETRYEEVVAIQYGPISADKRLACSHP